MPCSGGARCTPPRNGLGVVAWGVHGAPLGMDPAEYETAPSGINRFSVTLGGLHFRVSR